ncbi:MULTISPECIES: aldo/keto reductase [unclassified Paenibacillus]|uniref:aldo/keto reductase n=1 Tax=unclassified Paenibacillus TaxID=185978 RepID=UPI001AE204B1|nr:MULTISPECIES: aldo/keto reductase [unclassified Paenibacillus]MBP1154330.1 diketogulonate reductase-like aldo/keto reductase [Paenibacillus sp. PvP091]MBP1170286.1 diketogulonate reductase-like aldo/keto reductase [Paenibacillus sp. PvR098]MBP2441314.1 diketogulonate reductase-like aldo/keto reductase [Paenibacillus sp. PvP052]
MTKIQQIGDTKELRGGIRMPWVGLGVWKTKDDEVTQAVQYALDAGYRSIDTAAVYGNEAGVGKALQATSIPRDLLFITTKVWNADQGYDSTLRAFEESRRKLQLEVIDLYLVHWPVKDKYKETWKALVKLQKEGYVRAIGVSNFQPHHLQDIIDDSGVVPLVNQVEFHPLLQQTELRAFCRQHEIQLEAWSPLMQGNLDLPLLSELANKYGKTPAQIILRWDLQHGVVTIPKSVRESRIRENSDIFDFTLSDEDMMRIDGLNQNKRFGADPDNFDF